MPDIDPITQQHLDKIREYIDRMPSLSTTVTKVLEVCNQPTTSPNDLNRVISLDPVLTGQVLKLINSAYYSLPNQITSLTRAIIMLGINTVKNLALSTAILGSVGKEGMDCLSMDDYLAHSISVGVTAKAIATQASVPLAQREEFFVAGLLHDLGKIPLSNCFPADYRKVLELCDLQRCSLVRAESMIFGFDHRTAGRIIARKWQLNNNMIETLWHHHAPQKATDENRNLVKTVALANLYANIFEIGSAGDHYQEPALAQQIIHDSGMDWHEISALHSTVEMEVEKAQIFLQVAR
ncbi:MAG: HDOD domain-containing protein [Thermodesulfobacteriota bacterium]